MSAGGAPQVVDIGPVTWACEFRVETMTRVSTGVWEAWLHSLRGGLRQFRGVPPRHRWPMSRPSGFAGLLYAGSQWSGSANLAVIASSRDSVTVNQVPNGLLIQPGDFFSFSDGTRNHLHRVVEGGTSSSNQVVLGVEPIVRPGVVTGVQVAFEAPWCPMVLADDPSISLSVTGRHGQFAFRGSQVLL